MSYIGERDIPIEDGWVGNFGPAVTHHPVSTSERTCFCETDACYCEPDNDEVSA